MSGATFLPALLATLAIAATAGASPFIPLLEVTRDVRVQVATVEAHAELASQEGRPGRVARRRMHDQLDDIRRDLRRVESLLLQPITSGAELKRLERRLDRLDEQACEVQQAALQLISASARSRFVRTSARRLPPAYPGVTRVDRPGRSRLVTAVAVHAGLTRREAALCKAAEDLRLLTSTLRALVCE